MSYSEISVPSQEIRLSIARVLWAEAKLTIA